MMINSPLSRSYAGPDRDPTAVGRALARAWLPRRAARPSLSASVCALLGLRSAVRRSEARSRRLYIYMQRSASARPANVPPPEPLQRSKTWRHAQLRVFVVCQGGDDPEEQRDLERGDPGQERALRGEGVPKGLSASTRRSRRASAPC